MTGEEWIGLAAAAAWLPGVWDVWQAWRRRRERKKKTIDEGDRLVVKSALEMLAPLRGELAEAQAECTELRGKVRELTGEVENLSAELEHQRKLTNSTTVRLEQATRRADYWKRVAETRAGE